MSTEPDAIQNLRSALESGLNMLNASGINQEEFESYFKGVICAGFLPKAVAQAFAPINDRHVISEDTFNLVHYTSIDNLIKILKQGYLRLWDSAHFNDPDEGRYLTRTTQWKGIDWLPMPVRGHAYIASFIFDEGNRADIKDNLIFWRTYGKDGHGCSLEMPGGQFTREEFTDFPLSRVLYGNNDAQKTMNKLMDIDNEFISDIRKIFDPVRKFVDIEFIDDIIADNFEPTRYLYKSQAYDYENECRLVLTDNIMGNLPKFHYISSDSGHEDVRQYYEHQMLSIKNILVSGTTITLGPSVKNQERITAYLNHLLGEAGLPRDIIRKSEVSYRG